MKNTPTLREVGEHGVIQEIIAAAPSSLNGDDAAVLTEHSVSCVTAGAIMNNLDPQRYEIVPIAITREGTWTIGVTEGLEIKDGKLPEVEEADELTGINFCEYYYE